MARYKNPVLTVDGIVRKNKELLLIRRKNDPFKGKWALPGGFVNYGETVEAAVMRELEEETGLNTEITSFFGVYSDPDRDPRGHMISIVFELEARSGQPKGGDDAAEARFFNIDMLPELAFDHDKIIHDYLSEVSL